MQQRRLRLTSLEYLANPLRTDHPFGKSSLKQALASRPGSDLIGLFRRLNGVHRRPFWSPIGCQRVEQDGLKPSTLLTAASLLSFSYSNPCLSCRNVGPEGNRFVLDVYVQLWQALRAIHRLRKYKLASVDRAGSILQPCSDQESSVDPLVDLNRENRKNSVVRDSIFLRIKANFNLLLNHLQIRTKSLKEIHDFYRCWKQTKYYRTWKQKSKDRMRAAAMSADVFFAERPSN